MPLFRLSYPAHIYATFEAATVDEAKEKFKQVLEPVEDGIIIVLDTPKGWHDPEERLYPGKGDKNQIAVADMAVEDIEGEDGEVKEGDTQDHLQAPKAEGHGGGHQPSAGRQPA